MTEIRLDGAGTSCVLEVDGHGWCHFELRGPEGATPIGVQSIHYFAIRIVDFLERPRSGRQWVVLLLHLNVSIHGELLGTESFLWFEDETGKHLGAISVDPAQRQTWIRLLVPYLKQE